LKIDTLVKSLLDKIIKLNEDQARKQLENGLKDALPDEKYVNEIGKLFTDIKMIAYLHGMLKTYDSIAKDYDKKELKFELLGGAKITPANAIKDLILQLGLKEGHIFETEMLVSTKSRIEAVLSYTDFVDRVNTKLKSTLKDGESYREWYKALDEKKLTDLVQKKGYWETVYRTNISTAFSRGAYEERQRLSEYIAYDEWVTVIGVNPTCIKFNGQVREKGGFGVIPPLHYNCTSEILPVSKVRAKQRGIKITNSSVEPKKSGWGSIGHNEFTYATKEQMQRLPKEAVENFNL